MLLPMLKLTALASQSLLFRKTAGKCSMNARSIDTKVFGHGLRSSCLFSSLSVDSDSLASGGKIGSDDEDALALATKKAEKSFKGLTRMRLRKALKTAQSGKPRQVAAQESRLSDCHRSDQRDSLSSHKTRQIRSVFLRLILI